MVIFGLLIFVVVIQVVKEGGFLYLGCNFFVVLVWISVFLYFCRVSFQCALDAAALYSTG